MSGCNTSSRDLGHLPNSNSAGDCPVDVCGVNRYVNKNLASLVSKESSLLCLNPCLKVWTALSARPFDEG